MASRPVTSWQIDGETGNITFWGLQNHCRWWLQPWNKKTVASRKKSYDKPRQHIKKQRRYFTNKGPVKAMVFSVLMYGCESWTVKKAEHQRTDAFELWCWRRILRVLWTARRSNPSNWFLSFSSFPTKGNQSWIFIGKTDAEAEAPILWSPDTKN